MEDRTVAICLKQVKKSYSQEVLALDNIDLTIYQGERISIMGPSGSGKTTLLNLLNGLDRPTEGEINILGTNIANLSPDEAAIFRRENIGLVFQQFHLIPYLTAVENVMLAQHFHSMVDRDQALKALDDVQLSQRSHHLPSQLSGGEQQRVCIARALINEPPIILADEPTGNLDRDNEQKILEIFEELHRQGKTLLVVTHAPAIGALGNRRVLLDHGKISQIITQPS